MSYRVEKKVGDTIYLYEATSSWDPEKKQSRQTRTYLGRKDPKTGEVIPPRHSGRPRRAKDYGNVYVLQRIAERLGLTGVLEEVFREDASVLLALACFEIAESAPLYLFPSWMDTTFLEPVKALAPAELTTLTQRLGQMDAEREAFFHEWLQHCGPVQTIVFDITSISSYSTLINEVEWGYNRDHDPLPQVNLGLVYAEHEQVPLYYQVYPGSIRDVSTLPNMVRYLQALEMAPSLFVMDRGFYSAANLAAMRAHEFQFLVPLPRRVALFSDLVSQHHQALTALPNSFLFHDEILGHLHIRAMVQHMPVQAHLYFDMARHHAQVQRFLSHLWEAELGVKTPTTTSPEKMRQQLNASLQGAAKFFRISKTANGNVLRRQRQRIAQHLLPMGMTIFLTNASTLDRARILTLYRQKDFIEKTFETLKHEVDGARIRSHSMDALLGRIFVKFLSLIIDSGLTRMMREEQMFAQYSVRSLLAELKKLRLVELKNGTRVLTEISKRQKLIFQKFSLEPPVIDASLPKS